MGGSIRRSALCVKIILAKMWDVATLFVVGLEKKKVAKKKFIATWC